jgi:regulator of protease activity HflC (stomatin/prohibitin superfamily)
MAMIPQAPQFEITPKFIAKVVGAVVAGIIALSLVIGSFYTVQQGNVGVVTRFGAMVDVTDPGLHLKAPWVSDVVRLPTTVWSTTWEGQNAMASYSHDQQAATISLKITYKMKGDRVSASEVFSVYRGVDGFAERVVAPRTIAAVKTTFGQYTAAGVIQNRSKFNADVDTAVRASIDPDGKSPVAIEAITVQNIDFSAAYEHAVEERMKAEVEVARVTQNLERERKTAEIAVVQAKAEAEANLAKARAIAEATRIQGEAEAKAIRARSEALQSNPALVSLTLAEKWNGVLPTTMVPGGSVPFLGVK